MPRPRSISEEETLERALQAFWARGFDRTSIADLSAAIGIGPSSIYNAYQSKDNLYRLAMGHYLATYTSFVDEFLALDSQLRVEELVLGLLRSAVKLYTTKGQPKGCAMFQSGGTGAPSESEACAITHAIKESLIGSLQRRLDDCSKAGEELACPPRILALSIIGTMRGLSQMAADGVSRTELYKVAEHAARSCKE